MQVHWYGQSAFLLSDGDRRVFVDPFFVGAQIPMRFDYPAIEGVDADLLLITHEHPDHNNAGAIGGDPAIVRAQVGPAETAAGPVLGISSEHDAAAGTQAGHNVIYRFELDGLQVVHLGDLGQPGLRPEQREAIGAPDLLFVPTGGGYTIGADVAEQITRELAPRWVVPMHYGTTAIELPEAVDAFTGRFASVVPADGPFDTDAAAGTGEAPAVVLFAVPGGVDV
jgi:L-ascorbate metabolism protein UlaG (beta-lactamase superfamily)